MNISLSGKALQLPDGATVRDALKACLPDPSGVLAVRCGGRVLEWRDPVPDGAVLTPLTAGTEEGHRIYERSLRFVLLLALRRLYPGAKVRIEFSAGDGVFVRLPDRGMMTPDEIAALEAEMRAVVADDLPFTKQRWALKDAIAYFERDGQADKVALLSIRPFEYFDMYACGGMWDYFYGAMAASTGVLKHFRVVPADDGFVVQMPNRHHPEEVAPYIDRPKHLAIFRQSTEWCGILGVVNTADLAALMNRGDFRDFIRVNEALHHKAISDIADTILAKRRRVVLIAGPSSSGKTTFTARLAVHLRVLGLKPVSISLDNYYRDRDSIPTLPDGTVDLEDISALDVPLMLSQINALLRGESITLTRFNFKTGRMEWTDRTLRVTEDQPILIEGIHGLNPMMAEGLPEGTVHRVFVSALTCLNLDDHNRIRTTDVRLLRRIVRDHHFRGTPPIETLRMWESVRAGEDKWIFPYQEDADTMFNTALHYELPFLKRSVYRLLQEIPASDPCCLMARRLLKVLNYVPEASDALLDEIPPVSLLREFIGGSTFDEE